MTTRFFGERITRNEDARLLTGQALFTKESLMNKLVAIKTESPPSLHDFREDIPPAVETIYQTMVVGKAEWHHLPRLDGIIIHLASCL